MKRQATLLFASHGMIEDNKRQTALARSCVVRGFRSGRGNESFQLNSVTVAVEGNPPYLFRYLGVLKVARFAKAKPEKAKHQTPSLGI